MTRNSWKTTLKEALEKEDPVSFSLIDSDQKLIGHSIFARVNNESSPSLEIVPASSEPAKPNELRLLLTHYLPEIPKGDHVVVIGMNPSNARAFSGRVQTEKAKARGWVPETDQTARIVRGWLRSAKLKNTQRLTMMNLVPIINKDSDAVQQRINDWTGPNLEQIFKETLETILESSRTSSQNVRIIRAWGDPAKHAWVEQGQKWFTDFINCPHNRHVTDGILDCRLKFKKRTDTEPAPYPPHPIGSWGLKKGNDLMCVPTRQATSNPTSKRAPRRSTAWSQPSWPSTATSDAAPATSAAAFMTNAAYSCCEHAHG